MNFEKYEALKTKVYGSDFATTYKGTELFLRTFGYIANILSIVFAFFFLSNLTHQIEQVFLGQHLIQDGLLIGLLIGFEYLKRLMFHNVVFELLKHTWETLTIKFVISCLILASILSLSFYASLSGASELVDTSKKVTSTIETKLEQDKSLITKQYDEQITYYEKLIANTLEKTKNPASVTDLVEMWNNQIVDLKHDRDSVITFTQTKLESKLETEVVSVKYNQIVFIAISTLIELLILLGVGFSSYYTFNTFKTYEKELLDNPSWQKMEIFKQLLKIWMKSGNLKKGDLVISKSEFTKLIQSMNIREVNHKTLQEFLSVVFHLQIFKLIGKSTFAEMTYEEGLLQLRQHLLS